MEITIVMFNVDAGQMTVHLTMVPWTLICKSLVTPQFKKQKTNNTETKYRSFTGKQNNEYTHYKF